MGWDGMGWDGVGWGGKIGRYGPSNRPNTAIQGWLRLWLFSRSLEHEGCLDVTSHISGIVSCSLPAGLSHPTVGGLPCSSEQVPGATLRLTSP